MAADRIDGPDGPDGPVGPVGSDGPVGPGGHSGLPWGAIAGRRRPAAFVRPLPLAGWSPSSWGYDPALECFWAELRPEGGATAVRIGPQHLIATVPGLARAVARTARVAPADAYLALTA